jgi:RimJ/RimL family protein N-acetyltransferase
MAHPYWPIFDLEITTPRLVLRLPVDAEFPPLIALAREVIPDAKFLGHWLMTPKPEFGKSFAQFHWDARASWKSAKWVLPLGVFVDGEPAGLQGIEADDFSKLGEVSTGSWLAPEYRGTGLGAEMRAAVVHFAFAGLGALVAQSSARETNHASRAVSEKLGYQHNGVNRVEYGNGDIDSEIKLRLTREQWQANRRDDITIDGLDGCEDMFGLGSPA